MAPLRTPASRWLSVALLAAATIVAACGEGPADPSTDEMSKGTLTAASTIPRPESKAILTVTGSISKSNSDRGLKLDMDTLDEMPTAEATVFEPFVKHDVTFSGVMLDDLLTIAGADRNAESLFMTALDDYTVDLATSDLEGARAMLATRENGEPIKLRAGGPVRIVFLTDGVLGSNPDTWIWSVKTIEVRT